MDSKIEIYQIENKQTEIKVKFDNDTVWLNQEQLSILFERDQSVVSRHISNVFKEGELEKDSNMQKMHIANSDKPVTFYNLDIIISVGYRVKSKRATQFRQWATRVLKDYLIKGYAVNEKRLEQKEQEVKYLKTGLRILNRVIESKLDEQNNEMLQVFSKGLELLDDYDHETLDTQGKTVLSVTYPQLEEYLKIIQEMYSDFESDVFAKPKDESFHSSINQIQQSFDGNDIYPAIEEKAANLLYFIVKNHSFIDGNKRIAAACFLFFLDKNNSLIIDSKPIISNEALASLTLFIATSKSEEADLVKRLVVSILNRNREIE